MSTTDTVRTTRVLASTESTESSTESSSAAPATPPPSTSSSTQEFTILDASKATDEWELDCYSRPVVINGKKLWEVLITDSAGSFRFCQPLPSNQVNSKRLRQTVEDLMDQVEVKPTVIRFFRGAMFNMIKIALTDLPVTSKPSRCTFALAAWLEQRHEGTYPALEGYNPNMVTTTPAFLDVRTPVKLPDALRGEQYAFVSLPLAEFLPGGGVNTDTIGVGRLCPLPPKLLEDPSLAPADVFVQGVVILTKRAKALASWLSGTEMVAMTADLRKRSLLMETDIDTVYLMAKLGQDDQRVQGAALEQGKDVLQGLHFCCVQEPDQDEPAGFWLLRELPSGI